MTNNTDSKTIYNVFGVEESGRDERLIGPIGVAFPHRGDKKGANILLHSIPVTFSGKLVMLPREEKPAEKKDA